jgi:hypothetical protein
MRQTRRRGNLETQLSSVGVTLAHGSLVLEPPATGQLRYYVPSHVQLLEDQQIKWLVWDSVEQGGHTSPNSPSNHLALAGFLKLGDAPESALIKFARQWGPLGDGWRRAVPDAFPAYPQSLGELVRTGAATHKVCEPVDAWRRLAHQLEGVLRLVADLQRGQIVPWSGAAGERWDLIGAADPKHVHYESWIDELSADRPLAPARDNPTSREVLALQRSAIARVLHVWFKFGGVQLVPHWDAAVSRMVVRVDYDRAAGLHGQLAVEVASAVASPFGIVQCAGCGYPYAPERRRPRADRRAYCPGCSDGTSLAAKRDWWRRNRSARPASTVISEGPRLEDKPENA